MNFRQKYIVPILIFTVLLVLFFNFGQWFIFLQVKSFAESVYRENLLVQAELAASSFDGDIILGLQGESFFPPDLIMVQNKINRLKNDYDYFNVRLMNLGGEPLLGETLDDSLGFGFEYDLGPFISASAGISSASKLTPVSDLYLISAYAPIFHGQDSVAAVLGIDADYDFFKSLSELKNSLVLINVISLIFILAIGTAFVIINRRLISAQEALYQASALTSMGQMAATMAHEIKNPLGIIKATAERIKSRYGKDTDDRLFGFITEEVERLNSILAGYLDFARPVERGRVMKKADLKQLVENLLRQTRTDLAQDRIQIEFKADNGEYPVLDDGIGLRQALLNLLLNARDMYKDGGQIRIELKSANSGYNLKVIDHGGGIKKEVRKRIFEPFTSTKAKGSGLGLYISRKIIEQYGGRLTLKNNSEGGATAEIVLPVYEDKE